MTGGYLEDVYLRWESVGFNVKWLQGFNNRPPNNVFEESGIELYEQHLFLNEVKKTSNTRRLNEIKDLLAPQEESTLKNEAIALIEEKLEQQLKESGKLETAYRNKFREANTVSDVNNILSEAKMELSDSSYNRIKENSDQMKRKLKQEAHQELMDKQQKDKEERLAKEELEKEAERIKKSEEYETKRQESIRIQKERQEVKRQERELAEEIAENE